jgi:hypothetical protein
MNSNSIYLGKQKASFESKQVKGELVRFDNETYYKIYNSNVMRPFFMSLVSDSNHWMFISSNGGLTAGRKDCDATLFPYYTDDKITESTEITGSKTILQIHLNDKTYLWEPFSDKYEGIYSITRNLYKNKYGNKIIFEEINQDIGLTFRYQWNSSNQFGFVKKSTIVNNTKTPIQATLLDGMQNIMPFGVAAELQNTRSNLVDAYKKSELEAETGLGIFALSAIIVDKAEPSEALKSTIAWSVGLENPIHLISSLQLNKFRKGKPIQQETDIKAEKGAYFVCADLILQPEKAKKWILTANVNQGPSAVIAISEKLKTPENLLRDVLNDVALGTRKLIDLTGNADGLQLTADKLSNTRHFSNTLFNIMRGGIFDENYQIEKIDFVKYIANANKKVLKKKEALLAQLPEIFSLDYLKEIAHHQEDKNLKRLCFEYMPLKFSRRHGDPSRPWNKFSINTSSEMDGSKILDYEGNWRDIFQNWEALAHSYPEFIESMIHKFLNATTFDGYNPYRVTKDGFDWEVIEPNDPWSFIGYWGDHQIIYLLKFLEFAENHFPNKLAGFFDQDIFVYANVPYKIKSYDDSLNNPKDTIEFDLELHEKINQKKIELGADGALLRDENFFIYKVNLVEKLLATVLAKISNFIPEAGIWLNTQRPEWNDANNALVGNGVSMVTLCYLNRFLNFFKDICTSMPFQEITVSEELAEFFNEIVATFTQYQPLLFGKISDKNRKDVLDGLGNAGSKYRTTIYEKGFTSIKATLTRTAMLQFFELSKKFLEHTIEANKRADKLYHSYNLMTVENDSEISISYLPEMLEGQVAVLSSGYLSGKASLEVLDSLKSSALFRPDQYSYLLYPDKELSRFMDKNSIPSAKVNKSALLRQLIKDGNSQIIEKDVLGNYHFNGNFNNANSLEKALSELSLESYQSLVETESSYLLDIFEETFDHKSFTGRSGTFFGYEGLGSIYWHMVSKLLLAVQESCLKAIENKESEVIIGKLLDHYYEINEGIGVHKSPVLYGAFPTDPYSHTPAGKGAQQPGMTGQVKEDILSRFGELGVSVKNGKLQFRPDLLRKEEFLKKQSKFKYTALNKQEEEIVLEQKSLCFTYCQIPVIYKLSNKNRLEIIFTDKSITESDRLSLDEKTSNQIFGRTGEVSQLIVTFNEKYF